MRSDLQDNEAKNVALNSVRLGADQSVMAGNLTLSHESPMYSALDPNGSNRTVTLPSFRRGRMFVISHVGTANTLTVLDSNGSTVVVVRFGELYVLISQDASWQTTPTTFGSAGVGHHSGLVPDPGAVSGLNRFLMDDGTWTSVTTAGIVDAYKQVTDGTNTSTASGLSQLRLRSSDSAVAITVTENDPTYGDVADFAVDESHVDHDLLLHYDANRHVDHTGVSISTAANSGLAGGGTIAATRTLTLDVSNLTADTPVLGDSFPFYDLSGGDTNKATLTVLNGILDHNALLNYSANRHIDHTTVSISAGTGLTGGGDISASRTISLDVHSLGTDTIATSDELPFYDVSGSDHNKLTLSALNAALDHNSLANYDANRHIDHTAVSISTSEGIQGGGTIAATRSLKLDINGLTQDLTPDNTADYVATYDASAALHKKVLLSAVSPSAGTGITISAGTISVTTNGISNALLRQSGALAVIGRSANSTGNVADIQATAASDAVLRESGSVLGFGTVATAGIANNAISFAKMQTVATDSLLGRDTAATGNVENILLNATLSMDGSGNLQRAALTGDVTASAGSNATTIANDAVTYAKMQNISATSRILGRKTAAAGDTEECTLSEILDFVGSAANGDILYRNTTWQRLAKGADGTVLTLASGLPSWAAVGGTGTVTSVATGTGLTGGPITTTGTISVANNGIDNAQLRQSGALAVIGRSANSTGNVADIAASAASDAVLRESGSTIGFGTVATAGIANDAITYAKIQNVSATSRILGRKTAAAGDTEECTLSEVLDMVGSAANGDILYRTGGAWSRLGIGSAGNVLTVASSLPSWAAPATSTQKVIQVLQTTYATNTALSTTTPADDTTPTSSEGTQVLSQAITPADNTNKVLCIVHVWGGSTSATDITVALYRGTTCIQVATGFGGNIASFESPFDVSFFFLDSPASASAQTYSVRVGPDTSSCRLNGTSAGRLYGGTSTCTLTVMEIDA